jgi:4-carboxymuconolactone decarboxylase
MRYPPISRDQWSEEQRAVAEAIVSGPRGELRGPFVPLLHAPALAGKVQELGEVIRFGTGIPDALLEIAVCMTARARECANIWESHVRLAQKAGVSRDLLSALSRRAVPQGMSADEALVHAFCRELLDTNRITDATFAAIVARWDRKGAMELAGICGYYGLLACVLNTAERALEPGSVPFGV